MSSAGGRMFWPGFFGHGCFGQKKVQSRVFWPNAISTQKEALCFYTYSLSKAKAYTVHLMHFACKKKIRKEKRKEIKTYNRNSLF